MGCEVVRFPWAENSQPIMRFWLREKILIDTQQLPGLQPKCSTRLNHRRSSPVPPGTYLDQSRRPRAANCVYKSGLQRNYSSFLHTTTSSSSKAYEDNYDHRSNSLRALEYNLWPAKFQTQIFLLLATWHTTAILPRMVQVPHSLHRRLPHQIDLRVENMDQLYARSCLSCLSWRGDRRSPTTKHRHNTEEEVPAVGRRRLLGFR